MAQEEYEVSVRTIEHPGFSPTEALARLRSYTPGRGCFVLESLAPDTDAGRYSLVGYRVRQTGLLPPGADVSQELAGVEAGAARDSFAASCALASVGHIDGQVVSRSQGVRLHEDMMSSAMFNERSAVMVYDHHENQVHVAGRVIGKAAERLVWELEHGPDVPPIEIGSEHPLPAVEARVGEKRLKARAGRIQSLLDDDLEFAVLGEELVAHMAGAAELDVLRALTGLDRRRETPHTHAFFVDYGQQGMGPHVRILGLSSTVLHQRRRGEDHTSWASLQNTLPRAAEFGSPVLNAARTLREIEDAGRILVGWPVGYVCPGGEATWVLAERGAMIVDQTLVCGVGVRVDADTDIATLSDAAGQEAALVFRSLADAQGHAQKHPAPADGP